MDQVANYERVPFREGQVIAAAESGHGDGRDGLPREADGWLTADLAISDPSYRYCGAGKWRQRSEEARPGFTQHREKKRKTAVQPPTPSAPSRLSPTTLDTGTRRDACAVVCGPGVGGTHTETHTHTPPAGDGFLQIGRG